MARPRRRKGSIMNPVVTAWRVEMDSKERLDAIAERAGISTSELIDEIAVHLELTDQGIPVWMPALPRDGELPIDTA